MTVFSEATRIGDLLKREFDPLHNREIVLIAEGQNLVLGAVVSVIKSGMTADSAVKAGGNSGGGSLTLDGTTPVLPGAKPGIYTVRCVATASNSGTFRVTDPDGFVLGDVVVGATFANDIKFVLADVGTDFAVGDGFDVTVSEDDPDQYGAFDGGQGSPVVLLEPVDASDEATKGCVLDRGPAVVAEDRLVWGGGVTAPQKSAAIARLIAKGIVVRKAIGGAPVAIS